MSNVWWQSAHDLRPSAPPPRLHWTAVLVLSMTSYLLFWMIWLIVQAHWVKRVTGRGRALKWSVVNLCGLPLSLLVMSLPQMMVGYLGMPRHFEGAAPFFQTLSVLPVTGLFLATVVSIVTAFVMRAELQSIPIDLRLSGPMTFFFGPIYFQYFLDDLRAIDPQPQVAPAGTLPPTWRVPQA